MKDLRTNPESRLADERIVANRAHEQRLLLTLRARRRPERVAVRALGRRQRHGRQNIAHVQRIEHRVGRNIFKRLIDRSRRQIARILPAHGRRAHLAATRARRSAGAVLERLVGVDAKIAR